MRISFSISEFRHFVLDVKNQALCKTKVLVIERELYPLSIEHKSNINFKSRVSIQAAFVRAISRESISIIDEGLDLCFHQSNYLTLLINVSKRRDI